MIKQWKSVTCNHTGEPLGIICHDCSEGHPSFHNLYEFEAIKENMFSKCSICDKIVKDDYSVCPKCDQVYENGFEKDMGNEKICLLCVYGI